MNLHRLGETKKEHRRNVIIMEKNDKTLSSFPEWYIELQINVLAQMPRPGQVSQEIAEGWSSNHDALKKALINALLP